MLVHRRLSYPVIALVAFVLGAAKKNEPPCEIKLDATEVADLQPWGEKAQKLMTEWHPRLCNLLGSKGFVPTRQVELRLRKSNEGIAGTANGRIEVSSHWIEKHPDDIGLVIHELTHVIQAYPSPNPGWLTEGVADYIRWAIYEGKPLDWFPVDNKPQGYKASYQVTGGFLLWLELDRAPGIVHKLNAAMRHKAYEPEIFKTETGLTLDELWGVYLKQRAEKVDMARNYNPDDDDDEWDDNAPDDDDDTELVPCPYCKREIPEDAERCPYCEQYISAEDHPPAAKPLWIVVTVIVCLLGVFLWMLM